MVGLGLIIGGSAMTIFLWKKNKNSCDGRPACKEANPEHSSVQNTSLIKVTPLQAETTYENIKNSVFGDMYSRHKDAAILIKDSIESIRENTTISARTNDELDEITAELDEMMSED